ncbi:acyltransferase [Metapseudomonas boanensis]|uniref:Acyltransferase n=1 Tax=Metapseudomonas boanensis TaxID=2822138 RepID=A0ABS5XDN7_9GAMM|nr:acyltransferase [Pseudomonas boanensis]MBT8765772.1 acyltransferase [Pseudomonas boanensis]
MKTQIFFIYVRSINLIANLTPLFLVKNLFLRMLNVRLGKNSVIHSRVRLFGLSKVTVGENSTINFGVYLDNRAKISIGKNVSIAHDVKIYTAGHKIDSDHFDFFKKDVHINDYACIFSNALIMPGIRVGRGAVVLPGAVVTKDVQEMTVVGGNPATPIKPRNSNLSYELKYKYWMAN